MRKRVAKASTTGVVVAFALVTSAGCASSSNHGEIRPSPLARISNTQSNSHDPAVPTGIYSIPVTLQPKPMPIEAYLETAPEEATLDYAQQVMAASCMSKLGFHVKVAKFSDLESYYAQDANLLRSRWFGLVDLGAAQKYGYSDPPRLPDPVVDNRATLAADPAAAVAWDGQDSHSTILPTDPAKAGCNLGSQMRLMDISGTEIAQNPLADQLRNEAAAKAAALPAYQAVYNDYGHCLQAAGYDVPDPQHPFASPQMQKINSGMDRQAGEPAPPAEIKLAETDIGCKVKTNLVRRLEKIVGAVQQQLIEKNALALTEEHDKLEQALKRAAAVMQGTPTS